MSLAIHGKKMEGSPDFEYVDIGKNIHDLRAFLDLCDHNPAFVPYQEEGDVGIPAFVLEDGTVTLEPNAKLD